MSQFHKFSLAVILVAFSGLCPARAGAQAPATAPVVRIGTYDPRAIAVAFAASDLNNARLRDLMRQRDAAQAANDKQKMKQLEAQGQAWQRQLHRQGFAGAPVDDILDQVRDRLPLVAAETRVAAIVQRADWTDPSVETVDVTNDLVRLFDPSDKTLKTIEQLRQTSPITLDELEAAERKGDGV